MGIYKKGTTIFTSTLFVSKNEIKSNFPKAISQHLKNPKKVEYVIQKNQVVVRAKK